MPARFALGCPQSQCIWFSCANPRPEIIEKAARVPARFALGCPQSQCIWFSCANPRPPATLRALLRNMYKKRVAFLYTIMYYHTNVVKTPLKTPRKNGFAAIPIRELLRIHIITVRKRPCGCVRSVFVFRGGESRRDCNGIPEGLQHRTQPRAGNRGAA